MENENLQSKVITLLRFPLSVFVVLIHSSFSSFMIGGGKTLAVEAYPIYYNISYIFSDIIGWIAVPLFFFISGYLFFYGIENFSKEIYWKKIRKRIKSLFVPYIFWNLVVIVLLYVSQSLMPDLMSGRNKIVADYSLGDWFMAFWSANDIHVPINGPLWFIRDLMVVMLLSPLVFWFVRWLKLYGVFLLGIFWFIGLWFDISGLSIKALFFFTAGAWFSLNKKNFVNVMRPHLTWSLLTYVLIIIVLLYFKGSNNLMPYLHQCGILVGMVCAVSLSAFCLEKGIWKTHRFLSSSSFFIYAYHAMPLVFFMKILFKIVKPETDMALLSLYIICPVLTIVTGLLIYGAVKRWFPSLLILVAGGR